MGAEREWWLRLSLSRPVQALWTMAWAVVRSLQRASHALKGRKRLYASALAFKTLLALVPALAVLMAVLSHEAFTKQREAVLDRVVDVLYPVDATAVGPWPPSSEMAALQRLNEAGKKQVRVTVRKFAGQAQTMGWAGLAAFALVIFYLLRDVEDSFNFLWGVPKGRPILAQSVLFLFLLGGVPLLIGLGLAFFGWLGQWVTVEFKAGWFLSFLGLWVVCLFANKLIPHAKVRWGPAVWGSSLTALLLSGARWGVGWYAQHAVGSSKVYGALWMFPVMLLWFYLCWAVVLFGVETAYFTQTGREQNRD